MIQADSLSRTYQDGAELITAVNDLTFSIESGQRTAIIGKSGSGKSTLLNLLAGLDQASAGTLSVDGQRMHELSRTEMAAYRRDTVGMVFQSFQLIPQRTALQNVELPLIISGIPRSERQAVAAEWLHRVGLRKRLHHLPYALSGGEQQRVAIARALVHRPKILLADEPTGNLDTTTSEQIESLLTELWAESQVTFVMVTHNMQFANRMSDRCYSMNDGVLSEL